MKEYAHAQIGQEIEFISGYYVVDEERRISFKGRDLLVVLGHAIIDNSCCGTGGCRYAFVPGYVVTWKTKSNEGGSEISEVEPVADQEERLEIQKFLRETEVVQQVNFQ